MRKSFRFSVLTILLAAAAYAGGDPWKTKPYTQWDEKDVAAVLQSSPWVKLNVSLPGALSAADATPDSNRTASPSPTAPQLGAGDNATPGTAAKTYNIFWYSARTIREAVARRAVLKGTMTADNAAKIVATDPDTYQVVVSSSDMSFFEGRAEDEFKDAAFLELKKDKKKINPTNVAFQRSSGKVVGVLFSFPKKDAEGQPSIPADEKELGFSTKISGAWLRASFNLKQMADTQGQDL